MFHNIQFQSADKLYEGEELSCLWLFRGVLLYSVESEEISLEKMAPALRLEG